MSKVAENNFNLSYEDFFNGATTIKIVTLSIKGLLVTLSKNNIQHNNDLLIAERLNYHYAECHHTECRNAE
jgi:hypothetical protein